MKIARANMDVIALGLDEAGNKLWRPGKRRYWVLGVRVPRCVYNAIVWFWNKRT